MNINKRPWPLATVCGPIKTRIDTRPDYQRPLVWSKNQKQLLVDTLLRGYDVPKLYWRRISKNPDKYEVVDGQQRLHAIWDFYEGKYSLPIDADPINGYKIAGLHYAELPDELRIQLDTYSLDIIILEDTEEDEAREMFLRLQSGTTLRAAEKRNAMRSNMRDLVRKLTSHRFLTSCGFTNKRFDFDQVIAQIALLEVTQKPCDIGDKDLTKAYEDFADFDFERGEGKKFTDKIHRVLDFLFCAFPEKTPELKKTSVVSLYWLVSTLLSTHVVSGLEKSFGDWFIDFEKRRFQDEDKPQDERDPEMVTYHDYTNQATNSWESIAVRHEILSRAFMLEFPDLRRLDNQRDFTFEQRLAIFREYDGICQWTDSDGNRCGIKCSWSDWHADHIIPWSEGGQTTVSNGQVLCPKHNLVKGNRMSGFSKPTEKSQLTGLHPQEPTTNPEKFKPPISIINPPSQPPPTVGGTTSRTIIYRRILDKLSKLGWSPRQLKGIGQNSYSLDDPTKATAVLRYATKQQQGHSDYYFFGLAPSILEQCSSKGQVFVLLVCGDVSHVLIFPETIFRALMKNVPQAGAMKEWKIKIYKSGLEWELYPSGSRINVTEYLNKYPER